MHVLGTPSQLQAFCRRRPQQPRCRFCFDLDHTLVTGPRVAGDYSCAEAHARMRARAHAYAHARTRARARTHARTCVRAHAYVHARTRTHEHNRAATVRVLRAIWNTFCLLLSKRVINSSCFY
eukprot:6194363-Pleurochrysis_carterae.AAC.2